MQDLRETGKRVEGNPGQQGGGFSRQKGDEIRTCICGLDAHEIAEGGVGQVAEGDDFEGAAIVQSEFERIGVGEEWALFSGKGWELESELQGVLALGDVGEVPKAIASEPVGRFGEVRGVSTKPGCPRGWPCPPGRWCPGWYR